MALTGTIKDFGVADIFQLIGQQGKSGVLHLKGQKGEEIHISFHLGTVVGAEHVSRDRRELLGRMLVRARLISESQLSVALEGQKRTLRRLGDILVEEGALSRDDLKEMTQLQVRETLYGLFQWKTGTYEFEARDVSWDSDSMTPMRSEAVLMDGFRVVDEWPLVRKKIPSLKNTFLVLKELPTPRARDVEETSFVDFLGEEDPHGEEERRVMALVEPGRNVEEIIDLSRLGAFETCKALSSLVEKGFLTQITPSRADLVATEARSVSRAKIGRGLVHAAYFLVFLLLVAGIFLRWTQWGARAPADGTAHALRASIEAHQIERIRFALEAFRLDAGRLPASLDELVEAGLLGGADLSLPWRSSYLYERGEGGSYRLEAMRRQIGDPPDVVRKSVAAE